MTKTNRLILNQLETKLRVFGVAKEPFAPPNGWLRAIRTALGIPRRYVAKRMGVTDQTLQGIENREIEGTVTIKTLRDTAAALDLELVYGFVPKDGTLQAFIHKKAAEAAKRIVLRTAHTMSLEDQTISDRRIKDAIKEKTEELESRMPSFLWD